VYPAGDDCLSREPPPTLLVALLQRYLIRGLLAGALME
jgi:hypothetical protein